MSAGNKWHRQWQWQWQWQRQRCGQRWEDAVVRNCLTRWRWESLRVEHLALASDSWSCVCSG